MTAMQTATDGPNRFALIIGAMKSGTTSLFEVLAQHPEIAPAKEKEPEFFVTESAWAKGWDWYRSLWTWDPKRHKWAMEASTAYTTMPNRPGVPKRISEVEGAQFRFIYIMREPTSQLSSHARHALYAGWGKSLDEGIPEYMIDFTRYAMQIDEYMKYFPRESIYIVPLERFREDPRSVLREICAFLEIDASFEFKSPEHRYNAGNVFEIPRSLAAVSNSSLATRVKSLLPRALRHRLRAALSLFSKPESDTQLERYELNEQEKAAIRAELAADMSRLQSVYGVDVARYWQTVRATAHSGGIVSEEEPISATPP